MEGLEPVGTVIGDFSSIDVSKLETALDDKSQTLYQVALDVKVQLEPRQGTLVVKMFLRGREIGTTTIDFASR